MAREGLTTMSYFKMNYYHFYYIISILLKRMYKKTQISINQYSNNFVTLNLLQYHKLAKNEVKCTFVQASIYIRSNIQNISLILVTNVFVLKKNDRNVHM